MEAPDRSSSELPIVVIGGGPVGLAAAAHLVNRGMTPLVLEAGPTPGAQVSEWGHVRMFSPWRYNVDPEAARLLEGAGWSSPPPDDYPTGADLVDSYLEPLAALPELAAHIRYGHRVTAVGKRGFDRLRTAGRDEAPFVVHWNGPSGSGRTEARAVIDASGTWATPNPLGVGGLEAEGESAAADRVIFGLPDILGHDLARFANRHVLVVGGGDSAFTALSHLSTLMESHPRTRVTWGIRSGAARFGGGEDDQLPERGALGERVRRIVEEGRIALRTGFQVTRLTRTDETLEVESLSGTVTGVDVVVAATGFRPDHSMTRELRLSLDPASESAAALGPLIDPNVHSCGSVPPHGVDELSHPDFGYFAVGMKSYGRAPTFLLLTGYEQVRSVVAALAGDWDAARRLELVLPETGVCSLSAPEGPAPVCCDEPPHEESDASHAAVGSAPVAPEAGVEAAELICCGSWEPRTTSDARPAGFRV